MRNAMDRALLKHRDVMGSPTLILVGPDGVKRRDLRVVSEVYTHGFPKRLDAAGIS